MSPSRPSYFTLCVAEPFRLFFPLATLLGLSGVSLWPLYFSGLHKFYPGPMHARLMIEGFMAGFILGFLGTALPRLLSAAALSRRELRVLAGLYLLTAGLHIGEQPRAGDLAFIALMLCFGVCMARRARRFAYLPPSFAIVALGFASGLLGPAFWLCGLQGWIPGNVMLFGALLLNQGFPLFSLLGIGAFLLADLLQPSKARSNIKEERSSSSLAIEAGFSVATGFTLLISFWLEASDPSSASAAWLRLGSAIIYIVATIPFSRSSRQIRTATLAAHLGFAALVAGLTFPLLRPGQRLAGLHIVFLGGFSLITFTIATRVVLKRSGNGAQLETQLPSLQAAAILLLIGATLRAAGDFSVHRPHWLSAASHLWMLAAAIWGFSVLPKVRAPNPRGDEPQGNAPQ